MTRRLGQWLCASVAVLILCGCSSESATDAENRDQKELAKSLVDAAGTALAQNDAATAVGYYRGALTRDPTNVAAAVGLMQSLRLIGSLDEAREVAEKALIAAPDNAAVAAEAGKIDLATGQVDQAIKLLKRAAVSDPKDWRSRSALGLAFDRVGEYGSADQYYREALDISPDNAAVLNNYALSRAMANDLAKARTLLQRAAAAPDADMRVRQNLALVYALTGEMDKAEEIARHDLPPAMVNEELDYYRHLAATATFPNGPERMQMPALQPRDRDAAIPVPTIVSVAARAEETPVAAPAPVAVAARALPPVAAPPAAAPEAPQPAPATATVGPASPPAAPAFAPAAPVAPAPVAVAVGSAVSVADAAPPSAPAPPEAATAAFAPPSRKPPPPAARPVPMAVAAATASLVAPAAPALRTPETFAASIATRFTVQLGSFQSIVSAERAFAQFAAKGVTTKIAHVADRSGRYWFVVRAGEFVTGAAAHELLHHIYAMGWSSDAYVVRQKIADTKA